MDWGLISISRTGQISTRKRFIYPIALYGLAVVLNLTLRFAWTANRFSLFVGWHGSQLLLLLEIVEVCRRIMWNFIRIEWETMVQLERDGVMNDEEAADKMLIKMKPSSGSLATVE
jgi:hypothetical protein